MKWVLGLGLLLVSTAMAQAQSGSDCAKALEPSDQTKSEIDYFQKKSAEIDARLAPYTDPFARAGSLEDAMRIWKKFSVRKGADGKLLFFKDVDGKKTTATPCEQIRNLLNKNIGNQELVYDPKITEIIRKDTEALLADPDAKHSSLYSAAAAVRMELEYLRRFVVPEKVVDRDGKEVGKEEQKAKSPDDKKKKDGSKQKAPAQPEYPELPDSYVPHTKNTDSEGGAQEKFVVAGFNGTTAYFKQRNFNIVRRGLKTPFMSGPIPYASQAVAPFERTPYQLEIHMAGKKKITLYQVPGFEILDSADPRVKIRRLNTGEYSLETELEDIQLSLRPQRREELSPEALELFTRSVGFSEAEFPDAMRIELIQHLEGKSPEEIAEKVAAYLRTKYLYSVGERPETDPIEALKAGAFQCDMAAFAMVGILRDLFHLPARAVGGFRAKFNKKEEREWTYLVVPGEAHAWVEVFINGKWLTFDPTPSKKDEVKENEQEDDTYEDVPPPFADDSDDQQHSDSESKQSSKSSSQSKKSAKEHQKKIEENSSQSAKEAQERLKDKKPSKKASAERPELLEQPEQNAEKGQEANSADQKGESESGPEMDNEELANKLEIGSLSLNPDSNVNPLILRALRVLLQDALNPSLRRQENRDRLSRLFNNLRRSGNASLVDLAKDAQKVLDQEGGGNLEETILRVSAELSTRDVNRTYFMIHQMIRHLELYSRTLDDHGRIREPVEVLRLLRRARARLQKLGAANARDIAAVREFIQGLPPISQSIVKEEYGLEEVGPNAATLAIAKALREGGLRDFQLISTVSPLTDFILESEPTPETLPVKSWEEDTQFVRGQDFIQTRNPLEAYRALNLSPHQDIWDSYQEGNLYSPKVRREYEIPDSMGTTDDVDRVTIVAYDTSGSMDGKPGDLQAALIAAFADRALSDLSPGGRHRHKLELLGFDSTVHKKLRVTDTAETKKVIRNYRQELKNTGGGTEIQVALMQALAAIADAQKRAGEPLKKANIILMTDGQSKIDLKELRIARMAIDRRTPIEIMFVAINGTNDGLIELARESGKVGFKGEGHYRAFVPEHIEELIRESKTLKLPDEDEAFFTEKNASEIPPEVADLLDQAASQARGYLSHLLAQDSVKGPESWYRELELLRQPDFQKSERPAELWVSGLRGYLYTEKLFKDRRLSDLVVDDLIRGFGKLTGAYFDSNISLRELEEIRHLLREAQRK